MSDTFRDATPEVSQRIAIMDGEKKAKKSTYRDGYDTSQWVQFLNSEYYDRYGLTQKDRDAMEENHRMYSGLEFGQWPSEVVQACKGTKLLSQFNFLKKKVDSVVGNIVQNWYDVDYVSTDGVNDDDITLMKDLYYSDKEICDWELEFHTFLKNGIIKGADMMMYVDYRHDPNFGNIGLKTLVPGSVLYDPNWVDNNTANCKNIFTVRYMTAKDMKRAYPKMSDRIDMLIRFKEQTATEYVHNSQRDSIPRRDLREDYNNTYRVIEYHHMEKEKVKVRTAISRNGQAISVPEDASEAWFEHNKVNPEEVIEKSQWNDVYYVTAFAPDLDLSQPLSEGYGYLQVGRLPFFHWSYNRHNGRDIGLIDDLKDSQVYYNEMMSLVHELIKSTRRTKIIDPEMFGDVSSLDDLKEKFTDPTGVVFTEPGASREFPNGIISSDVSTPSGNEMNFMSVLMNGLSPKQCRVLKETSVQQPNSTSKENRVKST
jgi:hypothetical protein